MNPQKVDILIIGGGVIGVSIAYYTALQGAAPVLVEQGEIGSGSSYGNAGFLSSGHCEPLPSPGVMSEGLRHLMDPEGPLYIRPSFELELWRWLWRFYRSSNEKHFSHSLGIFRKLGSEGLEAHRELAELGGESYEYAQRGLLTLYLRERSLKQAEEYAARMKHYGVEGAILSGDEIREMEPAAGPQVIGGLFHRMDGHIDPAAFVGWLAGEAKAKGARFLTNTEVLWLESSGRKVTRVATARGDFQADQVVLAGGAWSAQLARQLGVRIPIQPAKGYSITYDKPENAPTRPLLLEEARVAVTPYAGALRLAGTMELVGMHRGIDRRRLDAIPARARQYLPELVQTEKREIWRGLRPCTPDGLPVFGRLHPHFNVIIAGGHGTKGMLLGPITGKYISRMLAGESIGMMERSLSPRRF